LGNSARRVLPARRPSFLAGGEVGVAERLIAEGGVQKVKL
jgi:hypothetical protein